jgi:hypothetical protein
MLALLLLAPAQMLDVVDYSERAEPEPQQRPLPIRGEPRPGAPSEAFSKLAKAFATTGWLVHMITFRSTPGLLAATSMDQLPIQYSGSGSGLTEQQHFSTVFSLQHADLPLVLYSTPRTRNAYGLVFEADDELWSKHVQCAYVTDANSARRYCCSEDVETCLRQPVCANRSAPICKAMLAGCGGHMGSKKHCDTPQVCSNATTLDPDLAAQTWMARYSNGNKGAQQCGFKASQRDAFVATLRANYDSYRRSGSTNYIENEVSMHIEGEHDAVLQPLLGRKLLGIIYNRDMTKGPQGILGFDVVNEREDVGLAHMRQLRDHFTSLGADIPILSVSPEPTMQVKKWNGGRIKTLGAAPYFMFEVKDEKIPVSKRVENRIPWTWDPKSRRIQILKQKPTQDPI